MSFFGKIKSVVRGNPVTKEYEVGRHVASAGPGLLWKVHAAVKKSTRQEASVFIFNKQASEFEKMPKKRREAIIEMLKKGPTQLVKLRHPRLLIINHPVEESGDLLAFATEPIFSSLANVLGLYDNMPSPLPLSIKEYELYPVEIQLGLLQLAEGLQFLHSDVKMMHGNLTPECVVISTQGVWKLMGFNFCCFSLYQSEVQTSFKFQEWDVRRPLHTNPSLDYLAPEYILSKSCNEMSDIYSYGMFAFAVYNQGKPIFENHNNMLSFKTHMEQISRITETDLGLIPVEFKSLVRSALAIEPSVRPDALQITKHAFFEEVAVGTLKYLDMLYERGDMEKSQFFKKSLARVVTKLPKRVVHQRVLPALAEEFRNGRMIPFVMPIVFLIAEDCTMQEYASLVLPVLIPAMEVHDPIQVPLIILQKMDLLLKKTPPEEVRKHILPMIIRSMEDDHHQIQELCVSILPSFASMVDYSSMKHSIVPRITALCIQTKAASLRIKCLVSLGQLLDVLDKHIVLDHVLPILEQIPSREPGVLMALLGIYHQTMVNKKLGLDKMMLATRILPFLIPLSIEPTLNVQQFRQFMLVIREMLKKVEADQQTHLEQLSQMEEQTKSTVDFAREVSEAKAMDDALNRLEDMFSGSGSHESSSTPRRGITKPTPTPASTATTTAPAQGDDMFAGLLLGDTPNPTNTTTTTATAPVPTIATTGNKPSPHISRSEFLKPTPASQPQPQTLTFISTTPSASAGYMPPPLQPQKASASVSGLQGMDLLSSQSGAPTAAHTGAGWSSNMVAQHTGTPGMTGLTGMSSSMGSSSSGGMFNGMQMGTPLQSQPQPLFSRMNISRATYPANQVQSHPPPSSFQSPPPPVPSNLSQGPLTGPTNQFGIGEPLMPTQARGASFGNAQTSWSPNIANMQTQGTLPGSEMQNSTRWSSNIAGSSQMSGSSSISGWSSNIAGSGSGMGHGQMQVPSSGTGMGWSGGGMGMGVGLQMTQTQPTATTVLMGSGQPLMPQNISGVQQSQPYQRPQPAGSQFSSRPAPGANPFADLSFLN